MMLSGSAFAADLTSTEPTAPRDACSGHVEAYMGGLDVSGHGVDDTFLTYGGTARANCNFNNRWNLQGDMVLDRTNLNADPIIGYGGTAHLFWRNPTSYAFGVFGSAKKIDLGYNDFTLYSGGPEFQVYINNVTLYGQAEFGQAELKPLVDTDFWGLRGEVRYFATENLRFDGELAYRTYNPIPMDVFYVAAQANYRFDSTPYTVFARYQYEHLTGGMVDNMDLNKFSTGLRVSFGGGTLLEEDRYGATMDTYRTNYINF